MRSYFEFTHVYLAASRSVRTMCTDWSLLKCFAFRSPVHITGREIDKTFAYIHAQMQNKFPFLWTTSGFLIVAGHQPYVILYQFTVLLLERESLLWFSFLQASTTCGAIMSTSSMLSQMSSVTWSVFLTFSLKALPWSGRVTHDNVSQSQDPWLQKVGLRFFFWFLSEALMWNS